MLIFFEWDPGWFGLVIGGLIIGAVVGFFVARWLFKKQLRDNPPINEAQIRAMYASMGKKPSEKQIRATMNAMKRNSGNF